MTEQIINTQQSSIGQLGKTGQAEKSASKSGSFSKLIDAVQKHAKQSEEVAQADAKQGKGKGKLLLAKKSGELLKGTETLLKGSDKMLKGKLSAEALIKSSQASAKGEKSGLLTKEISKHIQLSQVEGEAKLVAKGKAGDALAVDVEQQALQAARKSEKDASIGLGITSEKNLLAVQMKKVSTEDHADLLKTGSKKNQHAKDGKNAGAPTMGVDVSEPNKPIAAVKNAKLAVDAETPLLKGAVKQSSTDGFSLKSLKNTDADAELSKLVKSDDGLLKAKSKPSDSTLNATKLAASTVADDAGMVKATEALKTEPGIGHDGLKLKAGKDVAIQQGLAGQEDGSKVKTPFKLIAGNKVANATLQPQASAALAATLANEQVQQASKGQDGNMSGDDRGTGRAAAELLMADNSVRDVRGTRSDFAMQMAYRSAASFKPADAMLEISKAARDGTVKLDLMLEPATLGKIQVSLQLDAMKHIQVHLLVDQQASRQVLEQQLPQLRQALLDQGLNLSGFSMDMNSQQQGGDKASHEFARADGMNAKQGNSTDLAMASNASVMRMGVNTADDGSLSILA